MNSPQINEHSTICFCYHTLDMLCQYVIMTYRNAYTTFEWIDLALGAQDHRTASSIKINKIVWKTYLTAKYKFWWKKKKMLSFSNYEIFFFGGAHF